MNIEAVRTAIVESEIIVQWEAIIAAKRLKEAEIKNEETALELLVEREIFTTKIEELEREFGVERKLLETKLADASRKENVLLEKLLIMEEASKNCFENMSKKVVTADSQAVVVAAKLPKPLARSSSRTSKLFKKRICKSFPNGILLGTVKSSDRKSWRIRYDDGKVKELDPGDLGSVAKVRMHRTRNGMRKYKQQATGRVQTLLLNCYT